MNDNDLKSLHDFIVRAKAAAYVGKGQNGPPCRPGSHDLPYRDGDYAYLDSYFGGRDFLGQEVVWLKEQPLWALNYYGYITEPERIRAEDAGRVIKESLSRLYRHGRFLGGFENDTALGHYIDTNEGDLSHFTGKEWIQKDGVVVYELIYHGGLIQS